MPKTGRVSRSLTIHGTYTPVVIRDINRYAKAETGVANIFQATGGTILVVDDDEGVRTVATMSLERGGFRVISVRDGEECMAVMRQRGTEFDAVLLDMTMPKLSGAQTCRLIAKMRPELPVVMTSGYAEPDAARQFDMRDVAGFLQKPFSPANLVRMVQDAVSRRMGERR